MIQMWKRYIMPSVQFRGMPIKDDMILMLMEITTPLRWQREWEEYLAERVDREGWDDAKIPTWVNDWIIM